MIQGGDPTGTGRGGSSIYGKQFEDEITKDLKHVGAGILSMANSGPNTNGSQFFISYVENFSSFYSFILYLLSYCRLVLMIVRLVATPWLDGKHTIFGRVKSGMRTVQRMGLAQVDGNDRPRTEIKIVDCSVSQ
jgi:peptidyl-prolyl cis-trans isomerase-like 1